MRGKAVCDEPMITRAPKIWKRENRERRKKNARDMTMGIMACPMMACNTPGTCGLEKITKTPARAVASSTQVHNNALPHLCEHIKQISMREEGGTQDRGPRLTVQCIHQANDEKMHLELPMCDLWEKAPGTTMNIPAARQPQEEEKRAGERKVRLPIWVAEL